MELIGIELLGKKPIDPVGKTFRASHFDWPKLWCFCYETAPTVISDHNAHYGVFNDGGVEFDEIESLKLAGFLEISVETGFAEVFIKDVNSQLDNLVGTTCQICGGLGHNPTNSAIRCSACAGVGKYTQAEVRKRFKVEIDQVRSLATFLRNCGGFKIN